MNTKVEINNGKEKEYSFDEALNTEGVYTYNDCTFVSKGGILYIVKNCGIKNLFSPLQKECGWQNYSFTKGGTVTVTFED